ncbi:MAG: hypothetical protein FD125_1325 [bacterium]|nr:MAG: hypothetical protein FD125_1325 [bacterium]
MRPSPATNLSWLLSARVFLPGSPPSSLPLSAAQAAGAGLALAATPARLHPSAHLFWFDWTAPSLWLAHRYPSEQQDLSWRSEPEGLLIHRPGAEVRARRLSRTEWVFLDACRKGRPFGVASLAARSVRPMADISSLFADLIALGSFDSAGLRSHRP